jgi:hypothetical protein
MACLIPDGTVELWYRIKTTGLVLVRWDREKLVQNNNNGQRILNKESERIR